MKRILRYRPSPAMAVALVALVVAAGGVAFATIPDSEGVIHGCYSKVNGNLRLVESETACRSNETAIQWNQQGASESGRLVELGDVTLSDNESRTLLSQGPLAVTARCRLDVLMPEADPPDQLWDTADLIVSTTQEHSAVSSGRHIQNFDFGPGTPEADRTAVAPAFQNEPVYLGADLSVGAPDGTRLSGVVNHGVNALDRPDRCVFGGHLVVREAP